MIKAFLIICLLITTEAIANECTTPDQVVNEMYENHLLDKIDTMKSIEYWSFKKYVNEKTSMHLPKADFAQIYYSVNKDEPAWIYLFEKNCAIADGPIPKLLIEEFMEFNGI